MLLEKYRFIRYTQYLQISRIWKTHFLNLNCITGLNSLHTLHGTAGNVADNRFNGKRCSKHLVCKVSMKT